MSTKYRIKVKGTDLFVGRTERNEPLVGDGLDVEFDNVQDALRQVKEWKQGRDISFEVFPVNESAHAWVIRCVTTNDFVHVDYDGVLCLTSKPRTMYKTVEVAYAALETITLLSTSCEFYLDAIDLTLDLGRDRDVIPSPLPTCSYNTEIVYSLYDSMCKYYVTPAGLTPTFSKVPVPYMLWDERDILTSMVPSLKKSMALASLCVREVRIVRAWRAYQGSRFQGYVFDRKEFRPYYNKGCTFEEVQLILQA